MTHSSDTSPEAAQSLSSPNTAGEGARTSPVPAMHREQKAEADRSSNGPRSAVNDAAQQHQSFLVLTDHGEEEEELQLLGVASPTTVAATPADRWGQKRQRDDEAPVRPSTSPRRRQLQLATARKREKMLTESQDELDLLLGKEKATAVREEDEALVSSSFPTTALAGSNGWGCGHGNSDAATVTTSLAMGSATAIRSLPWATYSSHKLETVSGYFKRQFEYELQTQPELFHSYEPFFRDRVLDRISHDSTLCPVFFPAPAITTSTCGALPGCVLRDYQVEGVQFLLNAFHRGMSCILSDDMGLGKTAQISAFLHTLKMLHQIDGPHLIVAPLSTLTGWTRELARWAPQLKIMKYHGERQARLHARRSRHNRHAVVVTTPAVLNQDRGYFRKRTWVSVVMDEAHVLKGHDTLITTVSRKLKACFRVAVTGTPVHNNVREVWSLMGFLYPAFIASDYGSADDAATAAAECAQLLQHIMLRRTKDSVELGIPPRVDHPVTLLAPTYVQRELLSRLTAQALQDSDGGDGRQLRGHLSHQRVVCNHPLALRLLASESRNGGVGASIITGRSTSGAGGGAEVGEGSEALMDRLRVSRIPLDDYDIIHPSAKMRFLDHFLEQQKSEGHRCLLFSNFTSTLDLLQAMCLLRGYSFERLDGSCNRVERELSMLRFNAPHSTCFVFLLTTTAGGVGVTLTGADTVILFDAHFNPQLDRQAADRAHRIGQTRTVHVYRLCLRDTIEEHIREIAARKASLGDFIVNRGQRGGEDDESDRLTVDDIRRLFEQLNTSRRQPPPPAVTSSSSVEIEAGTEQAVTTTDHEEERTAAPKLVELSSGEGKDSSDASADPALRAKDDALVQSLVEVEQARAEGGGWQPKQGRMYSGRTEVATTDHCFVCGGIMHALEPLYHCSVCPKAYHAGCVGERRPKLGEALSRHWSCPRHRCSACGKAQAADGAIFMCDSCPRSFCFDCLDPRYLVLNESGTQLLHIRKNYPDMAGEGVVEKRSCYYITCLRCCGVESSSSSSSSESEDDEEGSEADGTSSTSDGRAYSDAEDVLGVDSN